MPEGAKIGMFGDRDGAAICIGQLNSTCFVNTVTSRDVIAQPVLCMYLAGIAAELGLLKGLFHFYSAMTGRPGTVSQAALLHVHVAASARKLAVTRHPTDHEALQSHLQAVAYIVHPVLLTHQTKSCTGQASYFVYFGSGPV